MTTTNKKKKNPAKWQGYAVIRSANATEVARVTFSLYRNYDIQFARKYLTHSHIHESRIIVLRI